MEDDHGAVMADPRLAPQVRQLTVVAARMGGQLRTNHAVSLGQALRLYKVVVPTTLEDVRLTAQRWSITRRNACTKMTTGARSNRPTRRNRADGYCPRLIACAY
ncbi:hypothetical protein JWR97_11910 [Pseudomonas cedrina subsp. fulgida]|nr:hypothetical protein [Pseudomonas cedrina subsp. fulgida]